MPSEKQLAANRRNAQHSTGPRTPAGKDITRFNAVRHALTADLKPSGEQELQIAARIVRDTWRLHRASANEENIYALGLIENDRDLILTETGAQHDPALTVAICNARTFMDHSRDFERASLYEQRLKRGLMNDYKLFHLHQKDRISREKQDLARPRTAASASNGSVFATPPADPKIELQIVNLPQPYAAPSTPQPVPPAPDPFWPC